MVKFARFAVHGVEHYGLVEGDKVRVIDGDLYGSYVETDQVYPLGSVTLLAPVKPSKIVGVGLNYKAAAQVKGVDHPAEPIIFLKPPSGIIGPDTAIVVPEMVTKPAFEVELAVVIGKQAKHVAADNALDYCFGYTLSNDVTAKDHMPKGQPWTKGKSFDTFTPVGPYIVSGVDPDDTEIALLVNGVERQRSNTSDMIFSTKQLIAFISSVMTLEAGDVILTGTPVGGGDFGRGDVIELTSPTLGTMKNTVE